MKLNQILILSLSAILVLACKKEEGPEGPQGPQGETGNANVQSQMITVLPAEWNNEGTWYSTIKPCSLITEDIASTGVVMAYQLSTNGQIYTALPVSAQFDGDAFTTNIGFEHENSEIYFFIQAEGVSTPAPGERTYKVVAIESSGLAANPGLDIYNYEEVKQAFDLVD